MAATGAIGVPDSLSFEQHVESKKQREASTSLGKDSFLQLLVAQLSHQDPLEPAKDTEFIAQLAQFSALEQMQSINNATLMTQANSMIGKHVVAELGDGSYVEGLVNGVTVKNGVSYLMVGEYDVPVSGVKYVLDPKYAEAVDEAQQETPSEDSSGDGSGTQTEDEVG